MVKKTLLSFGLLAAMLPAVAIAQDGPVEVGVGGSTLIHLGGAAHHVIIGNPAVVDVTVDDPRVITVFGKQVGGTTLAVLDGAGRSLVETTVVVSPGGPTSISVTWAAGKDAKPGSESTAFYCGAVTCVRAATSVGAPVAK